MCICQGKMNGGAHDFSRKKRLVCLGIITKHDLKPATRASEQSGVSSSTTLSGVAGKISAALRGGRWSGAAAAWCGPGRGCGVDFWSENGFGPSGTPGGCWESIANGFCVRLVCVRRARARLRALELGKPPKLTENQEPESESLTVPLAGRLVIN